MGQLNDEKGACNILSKYSPEYVKRRVLKTPLDRVLVTLRVARITCRLGLFYGNMIYDQSVGRQDTPAIVKVRSIQLRHGDTPAIVKVRSVQPRHGDTPAIVKVCSVQPREMLTDLGPSFIKAGQVLANRPDIMREDYMAELTVLQDDVPAFPDDEAMKIMEDQLGRPISDVFSSISEKPIAAASLGQVYKAVLRETGEEVAIKIQRPDVEPIILQDLYIFRLLAGLFNNYTLTRLGCDAQLIVDEFGEKLLEELDYNQESRNIQDFYANFLGDPKVKIPWVRPDLCGPKLLVMEWVNGIRCTDPQGIRNSGLDVEEFIRSGVVSGLRQLLEFGLFHGDPHPGNIFALPDGRIAYVDFGNVAQLSMRNKQILVDSVVHAVNEDYRGMADDFIQLGFLAQGTDTGPLTPALEKIWSDSKGQSMTEFNFRTVTSKFNELVYQYPIRIPERYSLVIRSLLTQEGICMTLKPDFHFLEVAYPYVAKRLLTDTDPSLRERLIQVLFADGKFQWKRLENLIELAKFGGSQDGQPANAPAKQGASLDLSDTVKDALKVLLTDERLRLQMVMALTEDNKLHVEEVLSVLKLVQDDIKPQLLVRDIVTDLPKLSRQLLLSWADKVLVS
eukprot:gene12595-15821_t